ncbi:MAG: DUF2191 domain-containing protein [Fibrobacterota bacterium]
MKVTAILPDALINDVKSLAQGKTITESLITALSDWSSQQHIKRLSEKVRKAPFRFAPGYSAEKIRELNRKP